jgi:hypothetical protein
MVRGRFERFPSSPSRKEPPVNHRLSLVAVAFLFVGCATARVTLPPLPEPDAPLEERQVAFRQFTPVAQWHTEHYRNGMLVGSSFQSLVLRGGWNVSDPRDLLPLVEPDSQTAVNTREMESKSKLSMGFGLATGGLMLGSFGLGATGLLFLGVAGSSAVAIAGLGAVLLAGGMFLLILPAAITYMVFSSQAQSAKEAAFSTYPESLRQRLRLRPEDVY